MIYRILKPLGTLATRQFFREIQICGAEVVEEGPLIIVANHPNVMLDGLLILALYRRPLWILAKATLFKGPLSSRFLSALHMVPVHRRQDQGYEAVASKNLESFKAACECLQNGSALLIFPEGRSEASRHVFEFKTGAARIAFQYASQDGSSGALRIQPVGITYSDFQRFNSSVTVTVGAPVEIQDYIDAYRSDELKAVKDLTDTLECRLRGLTAEVQQTEAIPLVEKIAKLYRSVGAPADDRERITMVAHEVARVAPRFPDEAKQVEKRLTLYLKLCSSLKLDGAEGLDVETGQLFAFLVTPFVLLGVVVNYLPYRIVSLLGNKTSGGFKPHVASWALSFAFFMFPLWYGLLAAAVGAYYESCLAAAGVFLVLLASGYYVNWHLNTVALFFFSTFWPGRSTPLDVLRAMRADLIEELESFRSVKASRQ